MPTRLPDFLVIGAQKCGTSWLREMLRQHPAVFMPIRELHFFDKPDIYANGPAWYARHFDDAAPDQVVGEKTPAYLRLPIKPNIPEGARRIHDLLPDAKLIAILRNPVHRAISALNHAIVVGDVPPLHSPDELLIGRKQDLVGWPVIEAGMYHEQISAFVDIYGRERLRVFFLEDDVIGDPARMMNDVCDFLGIARHSFEQARRPENRRRESKLGLVLKYHMPRVYRRTRRLTRRLPEHYPKVSDTTREELYRLYAPHNERLFEFLGRRPASGWKLEA